MPGHSASAGAHAPPVTGTSAGDEHAWFECEVLSALPALYGTALRLARNAADAEDLAAETIARAWTHLDSLRERSRFRPWLFRILANLFVSERRAHAHRPESEALRDCDDHEAEPFSLFERMHQPILLWWGNPEQEFLDRLLREDLERAVDDLADCYRIAVVMADLQGLSYQEIADALDVPIGTVRSRLARGRALLQRALWEHAVDAGLATGRRGEPRGER